MTKEHCKLSTPIDQAEIIPFPEHTQKSCLDVLAERLFTAKFKLFGIWALDPTKAKIIDDRLNQLIEEVS